MIYTLGFAKQYDLYIEKDPKASKGIGGSVFRTKEEALSCKHTTQNAEEFKVYGVEADWDRDTKPVGSKKISFRALVRPAKLVQLPIARRFG